MKLRPYIANYIEKRSIKNSKNGKNKMFVEMKLDQKQSTFITETVEPSDPDEFCFAKSFPKKIHGSGPTFETSTIEPSDPDEFAYSGETMITKTIEPSDSDEICYR